MTSFQYATYYDLRTEIAGMIQDTSYTRRQVINRAINASLDEAAKYDWPVLRQSENMTREVQTFDSIFKYQTNQTDTNDLPDGSAGFMTSSSTADISISTASGYQALGPQMARVIDLSLAYTDKSYSWPLEKIEEDEFNKMVKANPEMTGMPCYWTDAGRTPMQMPFMKAANTLWRSTLAGDTGKIRTQSNVVVDDNIQEGKTWDYDEKHAEITLNGTTWVVGEKLVPGWSLNRVTMPVSINGRIIMNGYYTSESTSQEFINIPEPDTYTPSIGYPRFGDRPLIRMFPNPDKQYLFSIVYKKNVRPLLNDSDIIEIPVRTFIVERSLARMYENMRHYDFAQVHKQNAGAALAAAWMEAKKNRVETAVPRMARMGIGPRNRGV